MKKPRKPLQRYTPLPRPTKPLARSTKPIERTPITNKPTKRKIELLAKTQGALDIYFAAGHAVCQICGKPLDRVGADPCHKWRRQHGRHEADEILAGHRNCHTWLDNSAHQARVKFAQLDPASCAKGGVVKWPAELKADLQQFLLTGIDRIKLGEK